MAIASLCVPPSREKRFSGVHCFLLGLQSSTPSPFPCAFLPSFLPSFLPLLFSSLLFSHTHTHRRRPTDLPRLLIFPSDSDSLLLHVTAFVLDCFFLAVLFFLLSVCLRDSTRFLLFLLFPRCSKCVPVFVFFPPPTPFKRN